MLQDGDSVTVIKDLKIKGSSLVVKVGTKVRNIKIVGGDHDIDCRIDGIGSMQLKSAFVKKALTSTDPSKRRYVFLFVFSLRGLRSFTMRGVSGIMNEWMPIMWQW